MKLLIRIKMNLVWGSNTIGYIHIHTYIYIECIKPLVQFPALYNLHIVVHSNSSTGKVEMKGLGVQGQPQLHSNFKSDKRPSL